jgi:CRP/FNR family transcriptional regulator
MNLNIKSTLHALDFFNGLNEQDIEALSAISSLKSYSKNTLLYYENTHNSQLLFLIDGLAKAYKIDKHQNEIFLYHIYQNHIISEVSSLKEEALISYSNVTFIENSLVLSIDYKAFKAQFLDNGMLCLELASEVIEQSKQLQNLVNREFILDSVAKVAMMIDSDLKIFNQLKRYDVSLMLHIQPSTLSRVLGRLKHKGIINIEHGKVTIVEVQELQKVYRGFVDE